MPLGSKLIRKKCYSNVFNWSSIVSPDNYNQKPAKLDKKGILKASDEISGKNNLLIMVLRSKYFIYVKIAWGDRITLKLIEICSA